jgi:hypothetical protein
MLVVDLMHEVELGVWKALFTHIVRILYAAAPGGRLVAILDERFAHLSLASIATPSRSLTIRCLIRYRQTPQFSRAIRKFTNNVSEMKKLAARDFEDLLQVKFYHNIYAHLADGLTVHLVSVFHPSV